MDTARPKGDIEPQPGPQWDFASTPADIAIYGGEAGGGKSWALVFEGLRDYLNPRAGSVIFRRTAPELTGPESLWSIANDLYRPFGARLTESPSLRAVFQSGAEIHFLHLQHDKDAYDHQGKGYGFIGFDELTHFSEFQFWYLWSRSRSTSGVAPYVRATCNPDPDSFVRKLISWWIGDDGFPVPERSGVLRWCLRINDVLEWGDTEAEMMARCKPGQRPFSVTFIHARLEDNPALTGKDPGYGAKLEMLPEVERKRLRGGNWNIRAQGGKYLMADYFAPRWTAEEKLPPMNIYGVSDYAVTEAAPGVSPDYTEHAIVGLAPGHLVYVLDWWSGQTASNVWVDKLLEMVGKHKPLCWFGEKGVIQRSVEPWLRLRMRESNKFVRLEWVGTATTQSQRSDAVGYDDASKRAKAIRGRSLQAMAADKRVIFPASAPWVDRVVSQLVAFPMGPDDAFDALSHICTAINDAHPAILGPAAGPPKQTGYTKVVTGDPSQAWKRA